MLKRQRRCNWRSSKTSSRSYVIKWSPSRGKRTAGIQSSPSMTVASTSSITPLRPTQTCWVVSSTTVNQAASWSNLERARLIRDECCATAVICRIRIFIQREVRSQVTEDKTHIITICPYDASDRLESFSIAQARKIDTVIRVMVEVRLQNIVITQEIYLSWLSRRRRQAE